MEIKSRLVLFGTFDELRMLISVCAGLTKESNDGLMYLALD